MQQHECEKILLWCVGGWGWERGVGVSVCLCVCVCVYMCVCVLAQNNTVYHFASFFNHLQVITRLCALPLPHSLTISGSSLSCVLCLCKILEQSQAHHSLVCSASAKFFNNLKRITLLCALSLQHTGENTDHGLCKIFKHTQGTTQTTASAKFLNNLECITLLCALFLQQGTTQTTGTLPHTGRLLIPASMATTFLWSRSLFQCMHTYPFLVRACFNARSLNMLV